MADWTDETKLRKTWKALQNKGDTSAGKKFFEERIPFTPVLHANEIWADEVPNTPPANTTSTIKKWYPGDLGRLVLTRDRSVPDAKAWVALETWQSNWESGSGNVSQILKDFVSPKFGQEYEVRVYKGDGTRIYPLDDVSWVFDYGSGILTFEQDPGESGDTQAESIQIEVYQYVGEKVSAFIDIPQPDTVTSESIYVDYVNGDDDNDGSSWATAVKTIDGALSRVDAGAVNKTYYIYLAAGVHYIDSYKTYRLNGPFVYFIGGVDTLFTGSVASVTAPDADYPAYRIQVSDSPGWTNDELVGKFAYIGPYYKSTIWKNTSDTIWVGSALGNYISNGQTVYITEPNVTISGEDPDTPGTIKASQPFYFLNYAPDTGPYFLRIKFENFSAEFNANGVCVYQECVFTNPITHSGNGPRGSFYYCHFYDYYGYTIVGNFLRNCSAINANNAPAFRTIYTKENFFTIEGLYVKDSSGMLNAVMGGYLMGIWAENCYQGVRVERLSKVAHNVGTPGWRFDSVNRVFWMEALSSLQMQPDNYLSGSGNGYLATFVGPAVTVTIPDDSHNSLTSSYALINAQGETFGYDSVPFVDLNKGQFLLKG